MVQIEKDFEDLQLPMHDRAMLRAAIERMRNRSTSNSVDDAALSVTTQYKQHRAAADAQGGAGEEHLDPDDDKALLSLFKRAR